MWRWQKISLPEKKLRFYIITDTKKPGIDRTVKWSGGIGSNEHIRTIESKDNLPGDEPSGGRGAEESSSVGGQHVAHSLQCIQSALAVVHATVQQQVRVQVVDVARGHGRTVLQLTARRYWCRHWVASQTGFRTWRLFYSLKDDDICQ